MTAHTWSVAAAVDVEVPDVIALLDDDRTAVAVAHAAVREARSRSGRVHFLSLLDGSDTVEHARTATFQAALRALRDERRVPVTFETLRSAHGARLVERSAEAAVIVVDRGSDAAHDETRRRIRCDVLLVGGLPDATS